nr:serine hydrolase domain-containing protein [Haliscomenobacter sp.]
MKHTFLLLVISLCCRALFAQNLNAQIQEFDAYASKAMAAWQMPGMAVAIVKDGKVIFKKGYGLRELGTTNAVNTQTQFACASTTKAMTAVCMAILIDEGKANWDDPVSQTPARIPALRSLCDPRPQNPRPCSPTTVA